VKVGIVGLGVVGTACKNGFESIGHNVLCHDIKLDTKIEDIIDSSVIFICVPTPRDSDGSCDTSIVESVIRSIDSQEYKGTICIKSTVTPGFTDKISKTFNRNICFVPEFLRERCATSDFIDNHDVCIIGASSQSDYEKIKNAHGHLPDKFVKVSPSEAEISKYFNNIYNAMLVVFANSFYEVCEKAGADYKKVKDAIVNRDHINDFYLECNEDLRGFGGPCLPKDISALSIFCKDMGVRFFDNLIEENEKYKVTVFDGMRST
jgi:UDPglucose 6-dehydrogenase